MQMTGKQIITPLMPSLVWADEVTLAVEIADFEDVDLSTQGYWTPVQEGSAQMLSGGWLFSNYYSSYFWGGFTASNRTDITQSGMDAQYTAVTGTGHESSNYAVAYTMGTPTVVTTVDGSEHAVTGCYITNNLWAYQNMRYGDYTSDPFGGVNGTAPDFFVLHATGKDLNGNTTGSVDFYLADYRFDNSEDDYIIDTWEWFDLSPLGEVVSVSFSLESSVNDQFGMVTPAYFCMDDFNGVAPEPETVVCDYRFLMSLYPNPTEGPVTISISQVSEFEYVILNAMGQEVMRGRGIGGSQLLNLSSFAKGVYFVKVNVDDSMLTRKLIVR